MPDMPDDDVMLKEWKYTFDFGNLTPHEIVALIGNVKMNDQFSHSQRPGFYLEHKPLCIGLNAYSFHPSCMHAYA